MCGEEKTDNSILLANYNALVGRVDSLCRDIIRASGNDIACRKGCDSCCRHFSLFPVEAFNIACAVSALDPDSAGMIRDRAGNLRDGDGCPLLAQCCCMLYEQRPIICRTHGLPIMIRNGDDKKIDFCPKNYRNAESIKGRYIIDLDTLNDTLAAINSIFIKDSLRNGISSFERVTIAEAVLLKI
ncbi:MAG: YkgJ family cysteine cluster protein [Geobacteraceae bacterium]|nr:YkgJ family cysteine cluster protein [Geobacteraceae bacterium]